MALRDAPPRTPLLRAARGLEWMGLVVVLGLAIGTGLGGCSSKPAPAPSRSAPPAANDWSREADRWLGTPYRWGGNGRGGIDCSGFALQIQSRVAGVRLPRTTTEQFRVGSSVDRRALRPGDLIFFNTSGRGVSHVGVVVGGDRFAHASTSRGVTYSRLSEDYWTRRYLGARRVRGR